MNSRVILPLIASSCLGFFSGLSSAQNATPAPPPPPLASKGKEAERAAAIQPPQVILPLPVPKLTNSEERAPGKRLVPIAVPAGTPPKPADSVPASVKASGALKPASTPDGLTPSASSLPPVIGAPPKRQPPVPTIPRAAQPPVPPDSPAKMTKDDALDAATRDSKLGIEAPRIPTPADRVPVVSSTSASGQFRVHGSDLNLRSRMSSHLDEISKELRAALKDGEVHVIPINVRLSQGEEAVKATSAGAPPVGVQITEVEGGGFHLQLDIREVPTLKLADIRRETVRVLLAERILRGHKSATPSNERLLLPDWIFTGTMQTLDFRSAERPLTMFAAIFKSGRIYGIEEIIEASPVEMDSLSRTIYETSCGALVMALIDQPDGGRRFNKFLNALAVDAKPERELLNAAFPGFAASASSLNKWWSLQMASLAKRRVADPLNADETIRALEDAITIRYVAKTEDVPKDIKKRPFEVPASLFIPPPSKPKPPAPSLDEMASILAEKSPEKKPSSKPVSKNKPEDALDDNSEGASVSKTEGSPWLRYLTFGLLGGKKQDSKSEPDKDGNAETEEKTVAKADTASAPASKPLIGKEETGSSGFLARLISRDNLKAAAERQKTADETARAKKEADEKDAEAKTETEAVLPKREKSKTESSKAVEAEIKDKPKSEGNDRGSLINPLNWFRGTKKPAQLEKEPPKEKSDKSAEPEESNSDDKKSALHTSLLPSLIALADWHSTPLAELWSYFSEWELRRSFLDFLKRKKPKDGDAKEDAKDKVSEGKSQPAPPAAAKKKDEPKPRIKSPPQTTNPNARPAAKPVKTADGSPRTTNPAAKPVPLPQAPPATSPAKDEADTTLPTLPPGSQWVEIHIEDYKHILNRPDREKILDKNANALRVLHEQASILLRPVILGYLSIVADLKEGKTKDIDKRLQDLRTFTMVCAQQTKAVRDYVDYYEANETEQLSGKFNDFLDLPNIIQKELPPREDPLARYLDAIDKEFSK